MTTDPTPLRATEFRDAFAPAPASSLRDAIALALDPYGEGAPPWKPEGCALVVLATPEMLAVRAVLRHDRDRWCCLDCWLMHVSGYNMPASVVAWIMEDDTCER